MILQSVIVPNDICNERKIYFHINGNVKFINNVLMIDSSTYLDTYTYMNLFDAGIWTKYTGIQRWKLCMKVAGKGRCTLFRVNKGEKCLVESVVFHKSDESNICIMFENTSIENKYFFSIEAETKLCIANACFMPGEQYMERFVHIGIIICTYKRPKALYSILKTLKDTYFFKEIDERYGKLSIYIVDNASELPEIKEDHISLFHNPNTGGSGGFARGMEEIRKREEAIGITNVILMDDDVEVLAETFYRLYALLSLMRPDYRDEVIAGRMFRMDRKWIQYTASEVWNVGEIKHIGWNMDMTDKENMHELNVAKGEYTGWWFGCFPMDFVRDNDPLPFFLHCDDVEYGLRHGGNPIVLNGIQVWHETYEYRYSPMIAYYDMRNSMIVNTMYGGFQNEKELLKNWKMYLNRYHKEKNWELKYAVAEAMYDYLKMAQWFLYDKRNRMKKRIVFHSKKICQYRATICWRLAHMKYKKIGEKAFLSYKKLIQRNEEKKNG